MASQKLSKTVGEGGVHTHRLETSEKTFRDGIHKHLFFVNDRLIMTDLDGDHWHTVDARSNEIGSETQPKHSHSVTINTQEATLKFQTDSESGHPHELQVEGTTLSGLHVHFLEINDEIFAMSLLPGDLIEMIQEEIDKSAGLKDFKINKSKDRFLEMDYTLVKRLNSPDFKDILKEAVPKSLIKSLTRMGDGLHIQQLVLSKELFVDVGQARRFVLDHDLHVRSSEDRQKSFTFLVSSKDKFEEATLQRIRITEGVDAIVGFLREEQKVGTNTENTLEVNATESLTENATVSESEAESFTDTLDSLQDQNQSTGTAMEMSSLEEQLNNLEGIYTQKSVTTKQDNSTPYVEIFKTDMEKRIVVGPLLIPEVIDLQREIASEDEIENASHNYMIKLSFQNDPEFLRELGLTTKSERGFMHVEFTKKIALVESYIAPVDFELNGRNVIKGTWIVAVKVFDDEIWNLVKAGKLTGFSIGGFARLVDEE